MSIADLPALAALPEKLIALREERGMSLTSLAGDAGLGTSTVSRVENGVAVRGETLKKIAGALHKAGALAVEDVDELAEAAGFTPAMLRQHLERIGPLRRTQSPAEDFVVWRTRCYAIVDRMLARSAPDTVELALHGLASALETLARPNDGR